MKKKAFSFPLSDLQDLIIPFPVPKSKDRVPFIEGLVPFRFGMKPSIIKSQGQFGHARKTYVCYTLKERNFSIKLDPEGNGVL